MEPFEKLVSQLYVPDIQVEVLTYLYIASYRMDSNTEEIAQRFGITRAQFNILNILNQSYPEPCTVGTLRERTLVVKSDISRIVTRLQKAGLVDCTVNKNDRRVLHVLISEKGRELFQDMIKQRDELLEPFNILSSEEILSMRNLLRKLLTQLEKKEEMKAKSD